jgi:hypothetical protein
MKVKIEIEIDSTKEETEYVIEELMSVLHAWQSKCKWQTGAPVLNVRPMAIGVK